MFQKLFHSFAQVSLMSRSQFKNSFGKGWNGAETLVILFIFLFTLPETHCQVNLTPTNNQIEVNLTAGQTLQITISENPPRNGYILVQAHAYFTPVTLSLVQSLTSGQYTTGLNIGVVLQPPANSAFVQNSYEVTVPVLLIAEFYDVNAPIPGGCNMELPIKTAPFLPTLFSGSVLTVEYPLGSWPLNVQPATCDRAPLQYDVYEMYLEEKDFSTRTAFDSIRLMTNISSIERNGKKVEFGGSPPSKVKFANYPGTGRIVNVILRTLTSSAAYTPTLSYGCYPLPTPLDDDGDNSLCQIFSSPVISGLVNAALLFIGLFLLTLGHRFYKCQLFLLGFCVSGVICYIILQRVVSLSTAVAGTSSTTVGALGGALWLALWSKFGSPMAPVLLAAFLLGSLFASILAYTPFGDITLLKDDLTFWLAYLVLSLTLPLAIISFAKLTSVVVSSIFGSYVFILPIDHFIGSNLKYIALNTVRRASIPDFQTAILEPPFQTKDLILVFVWATLSVVGILFQLWRERGRAPFPRPHSSGQWVSYTDQLVGTTLVSDSSRPAQEATEASPLLVAA